VGLIAGILGGLILLILIMLIIAWIMYRREESTESEVSIECSEVMSDFVFTTENDEPVSEYMHTGDDLFEMDIQEFDLLTG
jgi:hypothetical protein